MDLVGSAAQPMYVNDRCSVFGHSTQRLPVLWMALHVSGPSRLGCGSSAWVGLYFPEQETTTTTTTTSAKPAGCIH